jgi:putative nucleotidyltransferase with HDIG domain
LHVPAGSFFISQRQPLLLQAILGTCVGIAVHCKASGAGGILHLLLPEPVSATSLDQPEKYATTGIPLFIQSLLEAGAQRHFMVAHVAGGALVGPVSSLDLKLDIGGRTVDAALTLLDREGIEVVRSETGGFFTSSMNLELTSGQCTIEPAGWMQSDMSSFKEPSQTDIKRTMDRLKPIPQVALKVLRMIEEDGAGIKSLADLARKDQVITARTLQLANSALYGARQTIESLDHALVYLGQHIFVKMVISAALQSFFEQGAMGYSLCKGGLYHHAVGCALTTEMLARRTQLVPPELGYTAGLLHDIGKVVLDQFVTAAYPLLYRGMMEKGEDALTVENRILGIDHTRVGKLLATRWGFSDSLTHAIRRHHDPDLHADQGTLPRLVYLADVLMSRFHTGYEIERMDTSQLPNHLKSFNMNESEFYSAVDEIPAAVFASDSGQRQGVLTFHARQ